MAFQRVIRFYPAYDKTVEGKGVHGVNIGFYLIGEKGVVQFVIYTNWHLPHVQEAIVRGVRSGEDARWRLCPYPVDLGYHSPNPMYEGQELISDACEWTGGPCYYDGTSLRAQDVFEVLLREGDEGVWRELEEFYRYHFERGDA